MCLPCKEAEDVEPSPGCPGSWSGSGTSLVTRCLTVLAGVTVVLVFTVFAVRTRVGTRTTVTQRGELTVATQLAEITSSLRTSQY